MKKCYITTMLVILWVVSAHAVDYTWDGNGSVDNGGNWSDPLNWDLDSGYPDDASDKATLPYPSIARYVTNDVATTISQLALAEGALNNLVLGDDMEVILVDHPDDDGHPRSVIDLNGNTLTVSSGSASYFPTIAGAGTFIKTGTGQVTLNGELNYTGSFTVAEGLLKFRAGTWDSVESLTVEDGAAAWLENPSADGFVQSMTLNGDGYGSYGALHFTYATYTCTGNVTVATDATIKLGSAITITLTGDISGPGDLTLEPATGTLDLDGTYNYAINGVSGNSMLVSNGTLNIVGCTLDLYGTGGATEQEYVIIDKSGGTLTGEFTATNNLPGIASIDYSGTADNPNCVVLIVPVMTGGVFLFY